MHSYTVTILTAECIQVDADLRSARVLSVNPVTITIIVACVIKYFPIRCNVNFVSVFTALNNTIKQR